MQSEHCTQMYLYEWIIRLTQDMNRTEETDLTMQLVKELQADLLQLQSLLSECSHFLLILASKNTSSLTRTIEELNRSCYKHKLLMLATLKRRSSTPSSDAKPYRSMLCLNEEKYLGSCYPYVVKVLSTLKEDSQLFRLFAHLLKNCCSDAVLGRTAEDLVLFFAPDFASSERDAIGLLRFFKVLLQDLFEEAAKGKQLLPFEEKGLMINKMLGVFFNDYANREYIKLLFGEMFYEVANLSQYVCKLKSRKLSRQKAKNSPSEAPTLTGSHFELLSPKSKRGILDPPKLETEDLLLVSERITDRIVKKLPCMPKATRYLCKLIEQLALKHVYMW